MTEHISRAPHPQVPANETDEEREEREKREAKHQPQHRDPEGEHGGTRGSDEGEGTVNLGDEEAESNRG